MAENSDNRSEGNVKITDRRHFRSDGSPRTPDVEPARPGAEKRPAGAASPAAAERGVRPAGSPAGSPAAPPAGQEFVLAGGEAEDELPAVDFATLVLSFRTTALMHMGLIGDAGRSVTEANPPVNLDGARQMIEILSLLEVKTKGNLDAEEAALLEQVLYELRLGYVNLTRASRR